MVGKLSEMEGGQGGERGEGEIRGEREGGGIRPIIDGFKFCSPLSLGLDIQGIS